MDISSVTQNRRSRRSRVLLAATLETRAGPLAVKLRNLSAEGALVEAGHLPVVGSNVIFRRNDLREKARVVWVDGNLAGVAFGEKLEPAQVLRNVPVPRPAIVPDCRRPGFSCRALSEGERRLVESWIQSPLGRPGE